MNIAHKIASCHNAKKSGCVLTKGALIAIAIGLIARLILAPITSSVHDFSGWAANVDNVYAGVTLYQSGRYFYTPVWGYIIGFVSLIFNNLGITSFGTVVPEIYQYKIMMMPNGFVTNYTFNVIIKMPAIIFDLLTALLIYAVVAKMTNDKHKSTVALTIWFLTPIVISSSSIFGMFESVMVFFMVLGFFFFSKKKYFLAGASLSLSVFTKLFSVLVIPPMFFYMLSDPRMSRKEKLTNASSAILGFAVVFIILYLPVILAGDLANSFFFLTSRLDSYSSGNSGLIDNPDFKNIFYYIPLFIVAYLLICIAVFFRKRDRELFLMDMIALSIVPVFSMPLINGTPTYGVILVIPIIILYLRYNRWFLIPLILLCCINFMYGITYYGESLFAPLFVATNMIDLSTMCNPGSYSISNTLSYLTPLCSFSILCIIIAGGMGRNKEGDTS